MKNPFDKIYVLSLISNNTRQEFMKEQLNSLGLDFEFIYGVDFGNFTNDSINKPIHYPNVMQGMNEATPANFGCTITHYMAVRQAYEFDYKNVLILEDDVCFIKDLKLFEECLNSIPYDADFITWDPRFIGQGNGPDELQLVKSSIMQTEGNYAHLSNNYGNMCGGMMYALYNHEAMRLYINNQQQRLTMSDRVNGFFSDPTCNRYVCTKCLCTDQYNIMHNFKHYIPWYWNLYQQLDESITSNDFYQPDIYLISNREPGMQNPSFVHV